MTKLIVKSNYLLLPLLAGVLWSCSESYPSIAEPIEKRSDEVVTTERESDLIPIMPTLDAPEFHFTTRGLGPLDEWDKDKADWAKANFHVFAFQTSNNYGGSVDMTDYHDYQDLGKVGTTKNNGCLLYDRIMKVVDPEQQKMHFVDKEDGTNEMLYYYRSTPNRYQKYNFYTYYTDDAELGTLQPSTTEIKRDITIDGTQDIMHGFAYHTREEYSKMIDDMTKHVQKDQLNLFTADGYNQLLYSAAAGSHSINPTFHINHLLSKFHINVAGRNNSADKQKSDYKNVIITKVYIKAPTEGTLLIAKNDWGNSVEAGKNIGDSYQEQVAKGELITWNNSDQDIFPAIKSNKDQFTSFYEQELANLPESVSLNNFIEAASHPFHVTSDKDDKETMEFGTQLTDPVLLPPMQQYELYIESFYKNYYINEKNQKVLDEKNPLIYHPLHHTIKLSIDTDNKPLDPELVKTGEQVRKKFEPGKEYTINVYVYGIQQIYIETLFGNQWINGGTIYIDEDEDEPVSIIPN